MSFELGPDDFRLITINEVCALLGGTSRMFVYRNEGKNGFPTKVHIGANSVRYWRHEVLLWAFRQERGPRPQRSVDGASTSRTETDTCLEDDKVVIIQWQLAA